MPVLSPDGSHIAYRRREFYYLLDVAAGRETQLGNWTGDMTPAWLDANTIMVGDTFGNLRTVGLNGKLKRAYKIADLADSDKWPE